MDISCLLEASLFSLSSPAVTSTHDSRINTGHALSGLYIGMGDCIVEGINTGYVLSGLYIGMGNCIVHKNIWIYGKMIHTSNLHKINRVLTLNI